MPNSQSSSRGSSGSSGGGASSFHNNLVPTRSMDYSAGGIAGGVTSQNIQVAQPSFSASFDQPQQQQRATSTSFEQQQRSIFDQPVAQLRSAFDQQRAPMFEQPAVQQQQQFQPLKSSEITAQNEFLQVELDRLRRIKGNILRILRKYSRDAEKQTTLRAKLAILVLEENYLASLYNNLINVYGGN